MQCNPQRTGGLCVPVKNGQRKWVRLYIKNHLYSYDARFWRLFPYTSVAQRSKLIYLDTRKHVYISIFIYGWHRDGHEFWSRYVDRVDSIDDTGKIQRLTARVHWITSRRCVITVCFLLSFFDRHKTRAPRPSREPRVRERRPTKSSYVDKSRKAPLHDETEGHPCKFQLNDRFCAF